MNDSVWIVRAEWKNSGPTHYGPFDYAEQADDWAAAYLDEKSTCIRYETGVLSDPVEACDRCGYQGVCPDCVGA